MTTPPQEQPPAAGEPEEAPWADGPGHGDGEELPMPDDVPPAEEVPPSPS